MMKVKVRQVIHLRFDAWYSKTHRLVSEDMVLMRLMGLSSR